MPEGGFIECMLLGMCPGAPLLSAFRLATPASGTLQHGFSRLRFWRKREDPQHLAARIP